MSRHAAGRWASAPREPGHRPAPVRPGARGKHSATRQGSWVLAVAVVALAGFAVTLLPWTQEADASDEDGLLTTSSTKIIAWADVPHVADDGDAASPVHKALKDWKLRVSQTADLLNQSVQVSWTGATDGGVLQLMQCWSDGPAVRPTREQCAYGGNLLADTQGATRTRGVSSDPRETTYFRSPELNVVAVDGKLPSSDVPLTQDSLITLGGNARDACPAGTTSHSAVLKPPRDAVANRKIAAEVPLQGRTAGLPGSLTLQRGTQELLYKTVVEPLTLRAVAQDNAITSWPLGLYRFQISCADAADRELGIFVGFFEHADAAVGTVWRKVGIGGISVPFDPLGSGVDDAATDPFLATDVLEYVKPRTTNEVTEARSRPDRAGALSMEVFTDLEAQHLGCGRVEASGPRSCWLVAVPRWAPEPDGSAFTTQGTSPLSASLWDRRIEVPLAFAPVDSGCSIGSGLKQILSHDSAVAVLRSWQPRFCGDAATASSVLGPLQDGAVRAGLSQPNRMGVVTVPASGKTLVRAPIATSGVVVGFVVDRRLPFSDDRETYAMDQTRATTMRLTARLVAKLLTQSYDTGAAPNGGKTEGCNSPPRFSGSTQPVYDPPRNFPSDNPCTLYDDPEFLRSNPDFAWLDKGRGLVPFTQMGDVLVSANDTDAYQVLWQWLLADAEARAFLNGAPDQDGMRINPYYKGKITASTASFPSLDPTCADIIENPVGDDFPKLCQPNVHPRVDDDTKAAQAAIRGDTKRFNVTPSALTGAAGELVYGAEPRQEPGRLGMLVITSTSAAARFGLPTAQLRNSSGQFVAPTTQSMSVARTQGTVRPDGVVVADPGKVRGAGYPLTITSYGVVDVAETTAAQNAAFAKVLDYAADKGQVPGTSAGQLPPGYAPLSASLSAQTRSAAALLRNPASLLTPSATPTLPGGAPTPSAAPNNREPGAGSTTGATEPFPIAPMPAGSVAAPTSAPATAPAAPPSDADPVLMGEQQLTRGTASPVPLLPSVLVIGLVAAVAGRALPILRRPAS